MAPRQQPPPPRQGAWTLVTTTVYSPTSLQPTHGTWEAQPPCAVPATPVTATGLDALPTTLSSEGSKLPNTSTQLCAATERPSLERNTAPLSSVTSTPQVPASLLASNVSVRPQHGYKLARVLLLNSTHWRKHPISLQSSEGSWDLSWGAEHS